MLRFLIAILISANFSNNLVSFDSNNDAVKIGGQTWMINNLDVEVFQNGDSIPHVQDPYLWSTLSNGAWCYVDENETKYGKLYNWYAVNDSRGLAQKYWKIPSNDDWDILIDFLGGDDVAGGKIKSKGGWKAGGGGNNNLKLNCLPGAGRTKNGSVFGSIGGNVGYWSSSEKIEKSGESTSAWSRNLDYYNTKIYTYKISKRNGFYIRCIKE